jgi:hypothetical protein
VSKGVEIMIEQWSDGWRVVAYIDGVSVEKSPPLPDYTTARNKAEIVSERFEAQFDRVSGKWRRA